MMLYFPGKKRDFDSDDDGGYRQKRRRDNTSDKMDLRVLLQSKVHYNVYFRTYIQIATSESNALLNEKNNIQN